MSALSDAAAADGSALLVAVTKLVGREPFTDEETMDVMSVMGGNAKDIVAVFNNNPISRKSIRTLRPQNKLNDEVINIVMALMNHLNGVLCTRDPSRRPSHFFGSYFIDKLRDEGYDGVKRWSKKVPGKDIFALDKVFIPVNIQGKTIESVDSLGLHDEDSEERLELLKDYLEREHKAKKGNPLPNANEWELIGSSEDTPQQENGFDCGVFMLVACILLAVGEPLDFSHDDIDLFRKRLILIILAANDTM